MKDRRIAGLTRSWRAQQRYSMMRESQSTMTNSIEMYTNKRGIGA